MTININLTAIAPKIDSKCFLDLNFLLKNENKKIAKTLGK